MLQEDDIILTIYCAIAAQLNEIDRKHSQGKLYCSEIVLCGVLFVLSGKSFRRFYRWLVKQRVFPQLPERSRLHRLIVSYATRCHHFLGSETFFTILDSFGVEIIHPMREGRSQQSQTVSKKGKSNQRWIIGRKIAITINNRFEIIKATDMTANLYDHTVNQAHSFPQTITLTDWGFKQKDATPPTFKICKRGQWNERMAIETLFSLWTRICGLKHSFHRTIRGFQAKMQYLVALTNIIVNQNEALGFARLSMVQWDL